MLSRGGTWSGLTYPGAAKNIVTSYPWEGSTDITSVLLELPPNCGCMEQKVCALTKSEADDHLGLALIIRRIAGAPLRQGHGNDLDGKAAVLIRHSTDCCTSQTLPVRAPVHFPGGNEDALAPVCDAVRDYFRRDSACSNERQSTSAERTQEWRE